VIFAEAAGRQQGGTDEEAYAIASVLYNRLLNSNYVTGGVVHFTFFQVANQADQFESVTSTNPLHTRKFRSSEDGSYQNLSDGDCLDLYSAMAAVLRLFRDGPGYDYTEFRGGTRGRGTTIGGSRFGYPGTFR
jgi:hypothetical protein